MISTTSLSATSQIRLAALQQKATRLWTTEERRFAFLIAKAKLEREDEPNEDEAPL